MSRFYITTAIDYANGDPHLGHAFEKIGADAIARYRRLCSDDVHFLVGMDEHGQKVATEAADRGVSEHALVDEVAGRFQAMWRKLSISNDQFIRTTSEDHRAGVRALIERMFENSPEDFYEKEYEGWYCVGCESFKQDNEIIQGKCILHPTRTLQWVAEKNWFFRLTAYTDRLRELIANTGFLGPRSRRNEMLALLDQGLEDISASRWGGAGLLVLTPVEQRGDTDDIRLVRCAAQLSHRDWLSRKRIREAVAGRPACNRQGHNALSCDHLAGDADGGGTRASA